MSPASTTCWPAKGDTSNAGLYGRSTSRALADVGRTEPRPGPVVTPVSNGIADDGDVAAVRHPRRAAAARMSSARHIGVPPDRRPADDDAAAVAFHTRHRVDAAVHLDRLTDERAEVLAGQNRHRRRLFRRPCRSGRSVCRGRIPRASRPSSLSRCRRPPGAAGCRSPLARRR